MESVNVKKCEWCDGQLGPSDETICQDCEKVCGNVLTDLKAQAVKE